MRISRRRLALVPIAGLSLLAGGAVTRMQDACGPFTDVSPSICPYVLEMYYLGITAGTSATTFSPDNIVTRGQAAVFVSKSVNQSVARSSRRAPLGQWWTTTPHWDIGLGVTDGALGPVACDGADVWVNSPAGMKRVRASDGKVLETWDQFFGVNVAAMGRIFAATGDPGQIYMIDPAESPGTPVLVADNLGAGGAQSIAFDGERLWTANRNGSVSIVTPSSTTPWPSVTATTGFDSPMGLVFDGVNMWVTDRPVAKIHRLDSSGAILNSSFVGDDPKFPVFDGANFWIPNCCGVAVVRPSDGATLQYLQMPPGPSPVRVGFDGRRILLASENSQLLQLWDAASLAPIATVSTGLPTGISGIPGGMCSDGINFWLTIQSGEVPAGKLLRF